MSRSKEVTLMIEERYLEEFGSDWYNRHEHLGPLRRIFSYKTDRQFVQDLLKLKGPNAIAETETEIDEEEEGRDIYCRFYQNVGPAPNHTFTYHFDLFHTFLKREFDQKHYGLCMKEMDHFFTLSECDKKKKSQLCILYAKCMQFSGFNEIEVSEMYMKSHRLWPDNFLGLYETIVKYRLHEAYEVGAAYARAYYFGRFGTPTLLGDTSREKVDQFIEDVVKSDPVLSSSLYIYLYFLNYEMALCFAEIGDYATAYQLCNHVSLRKMQIGEEAMRQISHLKNRCIDPIKDQFITYPAEKVQEVFARTQEKEKEKSMNTTHGVIFTVTTCKRFDLFEKTMNSLLHCTKDIELIQEWLCVDDNSSEEDRALMQERYPFFKFIWKSPEEKGHAKSMNIIQEYVANSPYPYTLHMEDDWQSVCEMEWIRPSIRIIEHEANRSNIKQVVHNRQYVQLLRPRDVELKGGYTKYLEDNYRYIEHEFHPNGSDSQTEFWKRVGGGFSACYWPYYSLNPSIMSTEVYRTIGKYREDVRHFEMEYANRYTWAGFKTGFLDGIFRLHIGKLIGEEGKKNAYELNGSTQFSENS